MSGAVVTKHTKRCGRCARIRPAIKGWICRVCRKRCCAHLCSLKTDDGTACCGSCRKPSFR